MESFKKECAKENQQLLRLLKISPLTTIYILYVSELYQLQGLIAASVAWLWIVFLIIGWPKGFAKQTVLAAVFGIVIPFFVLPYLGH